VLGFAGKDCQYPSLYPYNNITQLNCQGNYGISLSQIVRLDLSIRVFCNQFDTFYITPRGYISFGAETDSVDFTSFCSPSSSATLVAPLFAFEDCSCPGSAVYYSAFSTIGTLDGFGRSIVDRATSQVRQYGGAGASTFAASTVVVITWYNVFPFQCDYYKTYYNLTKGSTFQLIIAADLLTSYAMFIYDEVNVEILIPQVFNGVKAPGTCISEWNPQTVNEANILNVVPVSTGFPGLWFYKLFQSTSCPPPSFEEQCLTYLSNTIDLSQDTLIPPCPCNGQLAASDPRYHFQNVDWFRFCFAYNIPLALSGGISFKQVCCYDPRQNGSLYTYAPYAGLPTVLGAAVSDVQIYQTCCINSTKYCNTFLDERPISRCNDYAGPAQALMWGDPHFFSVDGLAFTFNGIGEYTMTKTRSGSYVFQARTAQYVDTAGTVYSASAFVAFAAREQSSSTVEVSLNSAKNGLILVLDGQQKTVGSMQSNSSLYIVQTSTTINVTFPSGWTLNFAIAGRFLSVVQTLPFSAWNNTLGLLGVYDGVSNNDLTAPNGTVLPPTSDLATIHYSFGQKWQISASESLFTYAAGQSTSTYSQPSFVPLFDNPCKTSADDSMAKQLCGISANCYYDYCVTGDSVLATATLASETSYYTNRQILQTTAPILSIVELQDSFQRLGYYVINVTVSQLVTFTIRATTLNAVSVQFIMAGNVSSQATASLDATTGVFSWTPTSTDPVDISFRAIDSNGAVSSILQVFVRICNGCSNHGTCNFILTKPLGGGTLYQSVDCICDVGWNNTGGQCADPYNACELSPCGANNSAGCVPNSPAVQKATGKTHYCLNCSQPGFGVESVSQFCTDIDECSTTTTSRCTQICTNTQGSYYCTCRTGYQLFSNYNCTDIDECSLPSGAPLCQQTCVNTLGSYTCACQPGYQLTSNNVNCQDINECLNSPAPCTTNQQCTNTQGSYVCQCQAGYRLLTDGSCQDINECLNSPAPCGQQCTNTQGSYVCQCQSGFRLLTDGTCQVNTTTIILIIKLQIAWNIQYADVSSTLFIKLKTLLENLFHQIIQQSDSVIVLRCFESSVGVELAVKYSAVPSQALINEANAQISTYLNDNKWQIIGSDGTVYPVIATPVFQIDNQTVSTPVNPCASFTCRNGGTCISVASSGIYAAPTCNCPSSFTGSLCDVTLTTDTTPASLDVVKVAVGVSVPAAAIIIALFIVAVCCFVRRPSKQALGYSLNLMDDSNSSIQNEPLGLEGKRSLRMHRFWPLNLTNSNNNGAL
jgi:hypothetical protein